jgi:hypothetical protein
MGWQVLQTTGEVWGIGMSRCISEMRAMTSTTMGKP